MTREEINKLNPSQPCCDIAEEEIWYEMGLIEGLAAADKEPNTSVLWHKSNHKPEEGELIVCVDTDCEWHTGSFDRMGNGEGYYAVWDYCILQCYWEDVKMWAYAKRPVAERRREMKCSNCKYYVRSKVYGNNCSCAGSRPCDTERIYKQNKVKSDKRRRYYE